MVSPGFSFSVSDRSYSVHVIVYSIAAHMDPISIEKKSGERECRVSFSQSVARQYELNIMYHHRGETWTASKRGSPAEIAEFIELAVPNLPDSKLINSALEELRASYPLLEIT
jgi:hypothetical protein